MKNNNAFFERELTELKLLGTSDSDALELSKIINTYPVEYDVIKKMIMCGLSVERIKEFCDICYNNCCIIEDCWHWYRRFLIYGLIKED